VRTAVITLTSKARRDHLDRQEEWLAIVVPKAIRVLVHLDEAAPPGGGATIVHVPPGRDGMRLARGRNLGARIAIEHGAELLLFLDVDCLPHPDAIAAYERAAVEHTTGAGTLLCGPVTYLAEGDIPGGPAEADRFVSPHPARPAPAAGIVRPAAESEWDLFWSLSFACTTGTWAMAGGFDERYEGYGGEDTDFAATARAAGVGLAWVGGAHALHQYHPTSAPPWQHLDAILRNGEHFARKWGRWPMTGWIDAFAAAGAIEHVDGIWRRVA
jgi:GT2 family glycosyltransferase